MLGAQLVNLLCNAVVCVFPSILLFMNTIEWTKYELTLHGSVCTCRHFACGIRALRLIYLFTLSLVKAVHACYIAAMFDDRTKNPKEQVEHCQEDT